jgi:hypothetical protein
VELSFIAMLRRDHEGKNAALEGGKKRQQDLLVKHANEGLSAIPLRSHHQYSLFSFKHARS